MPILAALGLLDANDALRPVDILDLQPHHLAGAQAAAIAETEQCADLEAAGDGEQTPRLVRAHHQRDLLRFTDVIDLGGKIQSPQRHPEQEPQPGHDAVAVADARARLRQVQLERRMSAVVAVSGDRFRNAANRWQLRMWPLCVPAQSLRAFMSSIMRWRNGLTVGVLMETPLLDEVDDTSILKTGHPATLSMISTLVNVLAERPLQRAIAQRFSGVLGMFSSLEVKVLYPT